MKTNNITEKNKAIILKLYKDVLVDWNMPMVDELVAENFISHDWPKGTPAGPQSFKAFYSKIKVTLPDASYHTEDIIAENDKVAVRWRLQGTQEGDFEGIAATGKPITLNGIAIYRIADDKVQERWVFTDLQLLLQQVDSAEL
ncbi:ester cyclase [Pedobacter riviphilus]|uniref:Ester cyclase n=1 Tax=Pedobacter riviphilus TaxID=2766984 RepID=A0ABX6TNI7_9SPHI|nr:ester cyclase [Pedobacter riviphilus]QNR85940.1 ester cyclase [Pedobacter riviphilus]